MRRADNQTAEDHAMLPVRIQGVDPTMPQFRSLGDWYFDSDSFWCPGQLTFEALFALGHCQRSLILVLLHTCEIQRLSSPYSQSTQMQTADAIGEC
jgi:hypothetical protein